MQGAPALCADTEQAAAEKVFKIASTREEWEAAFRLVHHAYARSGLIAANPYQMRITPFHLLPATKTFITSLRGTVICTLGLVPDGPRGIPIESVYPGEVSLLRQDSCRCAEVTCLADRRKEFRRSFPVLMRLMALMAQYASRHGIDKLVIAVHPRHVKFYHRLTAFTAIGTIREYPSVENAPAIPMVLDLSRGAVDHPKEHARFFGRPFPDEAFVSRPMTRDLRQRFAEIVAATYEQEPRVTATETQAQDAELICA